MAFRRYGGINFAPTNNIVRNHYSNFVNPTISNYLGEYNSTIICRSSIDLSGSSIYNVDELDVNSIHFSNGTVQNTAMNNLTPSASFGLPIITTDQYGAINSITEATTVPGLNSSPGINSIRFSDGSPLQITAMPTLPVNSTYLNATILTNQFGAIYQIQAGSSGNLAAYTVFTNIYNLTTGTATISVPTGSTIYKFDIVIVSSGGAGNGSLCGAGGNITKADSIIWPVDASQNTFNAGTLQYTYSNVTNQVQFLLIPATNYGDTSTITVYGPTSSTANTTPNAVDTNLGIWTNYYGTNGTASYPGYPKYNGLNGNNTGTKFPNGIGIGANTVGGAFPNNAYIVISWYGIGTAP
jgi:hypothetical protein